MTQPTPRPFGPASFLRPSGEMLNLAQALLDEAEELASFWPKIRQGELAPAEARDVLAVWAHLRRFPSEIASSPSALRLNQLVEQDRELLTVLVLKLTPAGWLAAAQQLAAAWKTISTSDAFETLERVARQLFDELDRDSLVVYAVSQLSAASDALRKQLEQMRAELTENEDFLADNPHVFLPAAALASATLGLYRANLDETDEALWLTTLKHHALEQLTEEAQGGLLGRPTAEDSADLKAALNRLRGVDAL